MNDMNISSAAAECVRGDIYYIVREDKNRPAVIVSNDMNNRYSPYVEIVYLTTAEKKPLPTHVDVMAKQLSTAQCENIYTIPKTQLGTYITTCTDKEMQDIDKALCVSLEIKMPDMNEAREKEISSLQTELSVMKRMYTELLEKVIDGKRG